MLALLRLVSGARTCAHQVAIILILEVLSSLLLPSIKLVAADSIAGRGIRCTDWYGNTMRVVHATGQGCRHCDLVLGWDAVLI